MRRAMAWEEQKAEILVIGGGAAGCAAAVEAKTLAPEAEVLIVEKAHIHRSGCLAMGLNAINAYRGEGVSVADYVASTRRDAHGVLREDLVRTIAEKIDEATHRVESWGLPIPRDDRGRPHSKGPRSIRILGESLKPILARKVAEVGARVINRHALIDLIVIGGRVRGAWFYGVRTGNLLEVRADAVILATGGASGLYRTPNRGEGANRMWYSPFNTGAGYAAALRAGAELTTLEMRFIPTRLRHTAAPTGTLAQTFGAREENLLGERFNQDYARRWGVDKLTSGQRLRALVEEVKAGRGPVTLAMAGGKTGSLEEVLGAYLDMTPAQVAVWAASGFAPGEVPVEISTSGPYILGGHTGSGLWVDVARRATLPGLYAAGDVAGGAPKKYVSGAWVEGFIAARAALADRNREPKLGAGTADRGPVAALIGNFGAPETSLSAAEMTERLQLIMDEYAGGISTHYEIHGKRLAVAARELEALEKDFSQVRAADGHGVLGALELRDRLLTARAVVAHLDARKETRWPGLQSRVDYPEPEEAWALFVNSRMRDGLLETFTRRLDDTLARAA